MPHRIEIVEGDITTQRVDAIVNAANSSPAGRRDVGERRDLPVGWPLLLEHGLGVGEVPDVQLAVGAV